MRYFLYFSLALMFIVAPLAHAQEVSLQRDSVLINPPTFFGRVFEGLGTVLTFGNKARVERSLLLAERRLTEAKSLAEIGDARAEEAALRYEAHIAKAQERADRANSAELSARVSENAARHITVLNEVLKRVPDNARGGVQRALENAEQLKSPRPPVQEQSKELENARTRLLAPVKKESELIRPPVTKIIPRPETGGVRPPTSTVVPSEARKKIEVRKEVEAVRTLPTPAPAPIRAVPSPVSIREEQKVNEPIRSIVPPSVVTPMINETPKPAVVPVPLRVSATIQGFAFSPAVVTVKKGTTVVWTNNDSVGHTVTGGERGPNSRLLGQGETYSFTFDTLGTFSYLCSPHPSMRGSVIVTE
ncbi:MAG: plastocyanin/azurin family copper-binding protein [bacterium]|nr:plastocyanin/azurin family copper-binding protein [bacterium]